MSFYDELSPYYDQMISFETRFENEKKILENVLQKFPATTILDAGCGSGYHSILLSSLKKQLAGFDPSEKMIELAYKNSKNYNCKIDFFKTDFLSFSKIISNKYDAIFSLGNSFVHLINLKDILHALDNFYNILNPGGYACIGIVNYDKILQNRQTEISKKEKNGIEFHRYYTLKESTITFNVKISGKENKHYMTELYPLTSGEFFDLAAEVGFTSSEIYGNLKLDKYIPNKSDNIVAFLKK